MSKINNNQNSPEELEIVEEGAETFEAKLKKNREELKKCEHERGEYLAGWQRAKADYINFQKSQERLVSDIQKFVLEDTLVQFLTVVDSFEQALKFQPAELKNSEWAKGILQIKNQLDDFLKSRGVEVIKTLNEKFNPEFHEAIEAVESEQEEGMIVEEVQKGYLLNGKVIRAARVKISKPR